jgi:hypothetical protein
MPPKRRPTKKQKQDNEFAALMAISQGANPFARPADYPVPANPTELSTSNLKDFLPNRNASVEDITDLDLSMLNIQATHIYNHICRGPMSLEELVLYGREIRDFIKTRRDTLGMQYGVQGKTTVIGSIFHHD